MTRIIVAVVETPLAKLALPARRLLLVSSLSPLGSPVRGADRESWTALSLFELAMSWPAVSTQRFRTTTSTPARVPYTLRTSETRSNDPHPAQGMLSTSPTMTELQSVSMLWSQICCQVTALPALVNVVAIEYSESPLITVCSSQAPVYSTGGWVGSCTGVLTGGWVGFCTGVSTGGWVGFCTGVPTGGWVGEGVGAGWATVGAGVGAGGVPSPTSMKPVVPLAVAAQLFPWKPFAQGGPVMYCSL